MFGTCVTKKVSNQQML